MPATDESQPKQIQRKMTKKQRLLMGLPSDSESDSSGSEPEDEEDSEQEDEGPSQVSLPASTLSRSQSTASIVSQVSVSGGTTGGGLEPPLKDLKGNTGGDVQRWGKREKR